MNSIKQYFNKGLNYSKNVVSENYQPTKQMLSDSAYNTSITVKNKLYTLFTTHPHSRGMTYTNHMMGALIFFLYAFFAACCFLIHSVFPFVLQSAGSDLIEKLKNRLDDLKDKTNSRESQYDVTMYKKKTTERLSNMVDNFFENIVVDEPSNEAPSDVLDDAIDGAVDNNVDGTVDGAVDNNVDGAVDNDVDGAVDNDVDGGVDNDVDDVLYDDVDGGVDNDVDDVLYDDVDGGVDGNLEETEN
jgi:hypothetical protein